MSLLLEDRAATSQDNYVHSSYYTPKVPVNKPTQRLKELAHSFRTGEKVSKDRDTYALFAKVAQSYRVKGWEWEAEFFSDS